MPFRDGALRVVQTFISLLEPKGKKMDVSNKKRFRDEYGEDPNDRPSNLHRPDDYNAVFSGNVDDHFRLGAYDTEGLIDRPSRSLSSTRTVRVDKEVDLILYFCRSVFSEAQHSALLSILLL